MMYIVREAFSSLEIAGIIKKENGRSPKVGVSIAHS